MLLFFFHSEITKTTPMTTATTTPTTTMDPRFRMLDNTIVKLTKLVANLKDSMKLFHGKIIYTAF